MRIARHIVCGAAIVLSGTLSARCFAQSKNSSAPPKPKIEIAEDEKAEQAIQRIQNPDERVAAIIKLMAQYPNFPYLRSVSYSMTRLIKSNHDNPAKVRALVEKFENGTPNVTPFARSEFSYEISRSLLQNSILVEDAEKIAHQGLESSNLDDYIANERRLFERKEQYEHQENPDRAPGTFSIDEAMAKYAAEHSTQIANMGDIERKLGKLEDAEQYYQQAYRIEPGMGAALGLSEVYESRGDRNNALKYLADAELTGKLSSENFAHLADIYAQLHPEKSAKSLDEFLDDLYRGHFHNPVDPSKYVPDPKRSTRVVLAEMITGAGCEPCTAVDLAFEAALHRYDSSEMALLVYHMHAPVSDPLVNHSDEERSAFYDADGAPNVYLDGNHADVGEGLQTETMRIYHALTPMIDARLLVPPGAELKVNSKLSGAKVEVSVSGTGLQIPGAARHLQIALVENEVSYSGENGFRFHPMVVRNLAQTTKDSSGFPLPKGDAFQVDYSFDLVEITAANEVFDDEYIADLKARTGITATFREKKNVMDPRKLSVVAFVQDDSTKEVLQAVETAVSPADTKIGAN